jgi:hypothetical protein
LLVKRALFLLNAAFAIAILDLIPQIHLPLNIRVIMSRRLRYSGLVARRRRG